MNSDRQPPRFPRRVVRWVLTPRDADRLIDALDDEYITYQRPQRTRLGADFWYWTQVLGSIPALGWQRGSGGRSLRLDVLHLIRMQRRSPLSAVAAVLTLALALGGGAAVLAVVDALVLTPLPFAEPNSLVLVDGIENPDRSAPVRTVGFQTFLAWSDAAGRGAEVEAYDPTNLTLTELGPAERVTAADVTPGFLSLLGARPEQGRLFGPDDDGLAAVIVSHSFWFGRLGGDPAVIGSQVMLGGEPHEIVGVLPRTFEFALDPSDLWRLGSFRGADGGGDGSAVRVVARLARDWLPEDLENSLASVQSTDSRSRWVRATPLVAAIRGEGTRTLALLGGAAALALTIAFSNLAVLLMVRSIDRRREIGVRMALGAKPSEPARQLALESVALVLVGTAGGVGLAHWGTPVVGRLAAQFGGLSHPDLGVSWRVVGAVALFAVTVGSISGFLPAAVARKWQIGAVLRGGATNGGPEITFRRLFVAGEVAVTFVLLFSMTLLGASLLNLLRTDPGFTVDGLLKMQVSLPPGTYAGPEQVVAFYSTLQRALQEELGADAVSIIDEVPLSGDRGRSRITTGELESGAEAVVRAAGPAYFGVMGIPLVAGRAFTWTDDASAPMRVVITASLAEQLFGLDRAVGRGIRFEGAESAEVVGVVTDVRHRALDETLLPSAYVSALQVPSNSSILVVRSSRPQDEAVAAVREQVERLDGDLPVYHVQSMRDVVESSPGVAARRLLTIALVGSTLLAVVLSCIGIFGVASHDAARRRGEFALRMALGADPGVVLKNTLLENSATVGSGLVVGGLVAIWVVQSLAHLLFLPGRLEMVFLGLGGAVVLLAAGVAAALPVAFRAARSDPASVLRGV